MAVKNLDVFLDRAEHLPPAPRILPQLLVKLAEPDTDTGEVVELIAYDPTLTAKALKFCNSAFYGLATPVDSLHDAVNRLGFQSIFILVASISGSHLVAAGRQEYGIDSTLLWKHSVVTALAAQGLARDRGDDETSAFTAGLLHDIGKLVLADALQEKYAELLQESADKQQSLLDAEEAFLGANHAEIAGRLLERWNFPPSLTAAVAWHHEPGKAQAHERLAACVFLADMVAHFLGHSFGHQPFSMRSHEEATRILGVSPADMPRYMTDTVSRFDMVDALCDLRM
ncbi:MAG: HDOD domain-containing protein [Verrucomicrobia bacterium]|nr:HDOD domain-containing protein [Verrucomicrobiota bacterium]